MAEMADLQIGSGGNDHHLNVFVQLVRFAQQFYPDIPGIIRSVSRTENGGCDDKILSALKAVCGLLNLVPAPA